MHTPYACCVYLRHWMNTFCDTHTHTHRSGRGACQLLLLPGAAAVPLRSLAKLTLFVATLLFSLIRAHHLAYFVLAYLTIVPLL